MRILKTMAIVGTAAGLIATTGGLQPSAAAAFSLEANKDAYIHNLSPDDNFGDAVLGLIKFDDGSTWIRKSYIGFDLGGLNGQLQNAQLSLEFVDSGAGSTGSALLWDFSVYGLKEGMGDDWGETTLTWNNAPANVAGGGFDPSMVSLLGNFTVTGMGLGTHSIQGAALDSFLNADVDGQVTLMVIRDTDAPNSDNYVHAFATREDETRETPLLQGTVVPEPGTLLLLGSGVIGLAGWRRRRE